MKGLYKAKKACAYLKHYGFKDLAVKALGKLIEREDYVIDGAKLDEEIIYQHGHRFEYNPIISILVPVYNPPREYFVDMLMSVINQTYCSWQLCLVDAGDTKVKDIVDSVAGNDERILYKEIENKGIAINTNEALEMATGDYIALLDNDDMLSPTALFKMVEKINDESPDCLYSDEDKVDSEGNRHFCPHFKPDFDEVLLRTNNYICHFFMAKRELALSVGGFSGDYDGAQDFDFILKCTEASGVVSHVGEVLYHWRTHSASTSDNPMSKLYAYEAGKRVIEHHLKRVGIRGEVRMLKDMGFYAVDYKPMPAKLPKVAVMIKGTGSVSEYIEYLKKRTDYPDMVFGPVPDSDYYVTVLNGASVERDWLDVLVCSMLGENADYAVCRRVESGRILYAGPYSQAAVGKPEWYKGRFNSCLLKAKASKPQEAGCIMSARMYLGVSAGKGIYVPEVVMRTKRR